MSTPYNVRRLLRTTAASALIFFSAVAGSQAQTARPSRVAAINSTTKLPLSGSTARMLAGAADAGRLPGSTQLTSLMLQFSLSSTQQADLDQLLLSQHDPKSAQYHQWLTPTQFNERFGISDADLARVTAWLQSQGFSIVEASPMRVQFSGTSSQVEAAFNTQLHQYTTADTTYFANSTEISLPAALNGVVSDVNGLNSLRPHGNHIKYGGSTTPKSTQMSPNYTAGSGNHYMTPDDVRTIYNVAPLYTAGYTGAGQTIVVVGQSEVVASDISDFRKLFGGNTNLQLTLVPSTGTATFISGDEGESDLDIEYSGAIAKDATINFVYTGTSSNVFTAIQYAIVNDLAPVISVSYGTCETSLSTTTRASYDTLYQQANAQGQTIVVASGDSGATGCDASSNTSATKGLELQFPGASSYVTAIGGTEFNEGSATYWNSTNNSAYGSALSYIPEMVWNDTVASGGLAAGGGGASTVYTKPSWQVATGVPADGKRDTPDISLDSASAHDPYFYCTSAYSASTSCAAGSTYYAGGTSFAAPIFAGILTIYNQATGAAGQGNFNTTLYPLYGTTPSAFHDITVGNNNSPCTSGSTNCPAGTTSIGYSATTGYDLATGLGSIDAYVLATALPKYGTGSQPVISTTTITASIASPYPTQSVTFTATVASTSTAIAGTVQFYVDGTVSGTPVTIANGTATSAGLTLVAGVHNVTAVYSGTTGIAASTGAAAITVQAPAASNTIVTLLSANPNTTTNVSVSATVNATTASAVSGTVQFTVDGTALSTPTTITNGVATVALGQLAAGKHIILSTFAGNTSLAASSGYLAFTVSDGSASTIALSINPTAPTTASKVTATAVLAATATGTVQFSVDGTAVGAAAAVVNGSAAASLSTLTAGTHTIMATYSGDAAFGSSSSSISTNVVSTASAFTLSATNVTLGSNTQAASTVNVTSVSTYAGTVGLTVTGSVPSGVCYAIGSNPSVSAASSATATVNIYTGTSCTSHTNAKSIRVAGFGTTHSGVGIVLTLLAVCAAGLMFRRNRNLAGLACALMLLAGLASITGCSDSGSGTKSIAGTYTLTVNGVDTTTASNTASTTLTLTIQ
ncbi:MAG: Ig-like domain repeat protein [Acidobacteriaceae bacterium]|nr:Ig-like domain repeat protein [Acidobacteriaceae bacterium]